MTGNEPGASEIEDGTEAVDPRSARRQRTAPVPTIRERTVSGTLSHNFKCDVMSAADIGAASGRRTKVVGFDSPRVALEPL